MAWPARPSTAQAVGVNSRLDAMQAAILSVHLRHLPVWTDARRAVASLYDAAFAEVEAAHGPVEVLVANVAVSAR